MHCDMQFLDVKINAFPCILNGACIAVPEKRYWNWQTRSSLAV